jgi:hypothetical protein
MNTRTAAKTADSPTPSDWQLNQALQILLTTAEALAAIDPTIKDDEKLYADMLEGEAGNALGIIESLIRSSNADDRLAEAARAEKADLAARQARFERRCEIKRAKAFAALEMLGMTRMERADFTAFRHKGFSHVVITDIDAGDLQPFVRIEKTPDKVAIGRLLKAGQDLDGATLSNPEPCMQVRVR